jgi:hypothetical protein
MCLVLPIWRGNGIAEDRDMLRELTRRDRLALEVTLIAISVGIGFMFYKMQAGKMVVLHLFCLPVVLSGFFLGRYLAGVLAVFCVLVASVMTALDLTGFAASFSPLVIGLAICVWGAALGLTAMLVGTLSDERAAKMNELHQAYVGVVEVLSRYLQGANPRLKARATRVAELSQIVAEHLRLPPRQVEDIRVAALLSDIGKIEITTALINRAVDTVETGPSESQRDTFHGSELVHSLRSLLQGAVPLLLHMDSRVQDYLADEGQHVQNPPLGATIIRAVRAYDALTEGCAGGQSSGIEAVSQLRAAASADHDDRVLDALQMVVSEREVAEPQFAS